MPSLEKLLDAILVDSFRTVSFHGKSWNVSPLNHEGMKEEIEKEIEREYKKRVPYSENIMQSLYSVQESIEHNGGISKEVYEQHPQAINGVVRDITRQRWWGLGGSQDYPGEDRRSLEVDGEFEDVPDGDYGEVSNNQRENIRILPNYGDEGTRFLRTYNEGNLETIRIYHQGHRDSLSVRTIDVDELTACIEQLTQEHRRGRENVNTDIPDADTFMYETLVGFNDVAREQNVPMRFNVLNVDRIGKCSIYSENAYLVLEFEEPHKSLGEKMTSLPHNLQIKTYTHPNGSTTVRDENDASAGILNFMDRHVIDERAPQNLRMDNTGEKISTYLLLGDKPEEILHPLLKAYIRHHTS